MYLQDPGNQAGIAILPPLRNILLGSTGQLTQWNSRCHGNGNGNGDGIGNEMEMEMAMKWKWNNNGPPGLPN